MSDTKKIIQERGYYYGQPDKFFDQLSKVWGGMLQQPLTASQCVAMMLAFKALRCHNNGSYIDSWVDAAGYADIGEFLNSADEKDYNDLRLQLLKDDHKKQKDRGNLD